MTTKTKPQREFFQTNKIVQGFKNKFERILLLTYFFFSIGISVDGVETSTTISYELDKPYTSSRNGVDEITVCSRPQENLLVYNSKVPDNGWNIENSTLFTHAGIVSTVRNLNNNATTTKYYR